ncbi:MAG: hypothetical protein H0X24_12595 [Ktedonobacterales bacterium]|nr:hypothetical protein [Ktedonobacterales bacterium]
MATYACACCKKDGATFQTDCDGRGYALDRFTASTQRGGSIAPLVAYVRRHPDEMLAVSTEAQATLITARDHQDQQRRAAEQALYRIRGICDEPWADWPVQRDDLAFPGDPEPPQTVETTGPYSLPEGDFPISWAIRSQKPAKMEYDSGAISADFAKPREEIVMSEHELPTWITHERVAQQPEPAYGPKWNYHAGQIAAYYRTLAWVQTKAVPPEVLSTARAFAGIEALSACEIAIHEFHRPRPHLADAQRLWRVDMVGSEDIQERRDDEQRRGITPQYTQALMAVFVAQLADGTYTTAGVLRDEDPE